MAYSFMVMENVPPAGEAGHSGEADLTTRLIIRIAQELQGGQPVAPVAPSEALQIMKSVAVRPVEAATVVDDAAAGRLRLHAGALEGLPEAIGEGDIQFWKLDPITSGVAGPDGFVGQVGVRWSGTHNKDVRQFVGNAANLAFLEVDETLRGKGLGEALINTVLTAASEKGQNVFLTVLQDNEGAKRLYERLGFERVGPVRELPQPSRNEDGTYTPAKLEYMETYLYRHNQDAQRPGRGAADQPLSNQELADHERRIVLPNNVHDLIDTALVPADLPGNDTKKYFVNGHPDLLVRLNHGQEYRDHQEARQATHDLTGVHVLPSELVQHGQETYVITKIVEGRTLEEELTRNPTEDLLTAVEETWTSLAQGFLAAKLEDTPWPTDIHGHTQFMVGAIAGEPYRRLWLVDLPDGAANLNHYDSFEVKLIGIANSVNELEMLTGRPLVGARAALAEALQYCQDTDWCGDGLEQAARILLANPGTYFNMEFNEEDLEHIRTR
jgi:ribosomal protein S18 acetylase RimI-like enzyme